MNPDGNQNTPLNNGNMGQAPVNPVPVNNMESNVSGPTFETIPEENITPQQPVEPPKTSDTIETLDDDLESSPIVTDNFGSVPQPPTFTEEVKKEKKKGKSPLVFIIIILLIIAIGLGVYYFLVVAKSNAPTTVTVKEVNLELGGTIPTDVSTYATVSGKNNCTVNTDDININKTNSYKFYVTCNGETYEGKAHVEDTTSPDVVTTDLTVLPNASVSAKDFIESCTDVSECTYQFSDADKVKSSLTTIGEYDVDIIVSDESSNETTVTAKLIVSDNAPVKYLTCTSKEENIDSIYANLTTTFKIGIDSSNKYYSAIRTSTFKFDEVGDYNTIKTNYNEDIGINDIIGTATFNDSNKTIKLSSTMTLEEFGKSFDIVLSDNMNTIKAYLTFSDYTCE
jgi:hypothetical protein